MPNFAEALKQEIARIARREIRAEVQDLRQTASQQRSQLAALRRRIDDLERQLKRANRGAAARGEGEDAAAATSHRFSAKGLATQRQRLGLSAADYAALLGVSAQSVYKWEEGKARPRARQLEAIAALRGIGKRAATARLEALRAGG